MHCAPDIHDLVVRFIKWRSVSDTKWSKKLSFLLTNLLTLITDKHTTVENQYLMTKKARNKIQQHLEIKFNSIILTTEINDKFIFTSWVNGVSFLG